MKPRTTAQFRKAFADLPKQVQEQARTAYRQFQQDPWHPSLRFKQVHPKLPIYSARVSKIYRDVGVYNENDIVWLWIGLHTDYKFYLSCSGGSNPPYN
ncbi:type II toxin-antitoxin system RelE family toxin [Coleofasciculus sp.]|uniref:type II toxin-antitoxin system RelE family toxin n=1 Tax=Coleofasciculus sp. TaxID=3100458 RepID=UPI003A310667